MVFGSKGPRDGIERTRATDMMGETFGDIPPAPPEAVKLLTEAQQFVDDRTLPFHRRMKSALAKADEAVEAFPDVIEVRLFRGSLRFQNLDLYIALLDVEKCSELIPDTGAIPLVVARILMELGDFKRSMETIDKLLQEKPDDIRALILKAEWCEKQDMPREAAEILTGLLPQVPRNEQTDVRASIARLLLDSEEPEKAMDILQPLIDSSTQRGDIYRLYGDALSEVGRNDHALDEYRTALHHNPGDMKAHFNMGVLLREMGYSDRSQGELEIVASTDPNDPDVHLHLFELALERGDNTTALQHGLQYLLKADEVDDDDPMLKFLDEAGEDFGPHEAVLYGQYLIENGEPEHAIEFLTPLAQDTNISPPFEVLLSQAYHNLDATRKALQWTDKALSHYVEDAEGFIISDHPFAPDEAEGGDYAELICRKADLLLSQGATDKAVDMLEELGDDDTQKHWALRIRGEAAFLKGDYEAALAHFHEALDEHPADVDTLASLGAAYRKLGRNEQAINYYLRAHLNDTTDIAVLKALAELFVEAGRKREAELFLGKYLELEDDPEQSAWAKGAIEKLS